MKYNFDEIIDRRNTDCIKWDHMKNMDERTPEDALPFWIADMEFKVAQEIIDDLHQRVDHGIFGYSQPAETYYDAIKGWYKKRFDWEIKRESIFHAPGIVPALAYLLDALTKPGDGVIIQPPVYYPFSNTINGQKRKLVANNLINDEGYYTINFEELEKLASDENNKVMIFCTPHNPVGRVWSKEELLKVIEICQKTNTILLADEIHCDLLRKDIVHYPLMSLIKDTRNIVSLVAPSKTFNLAGLQMSVIVIDDENIQEKYLNSMVSKFSAGLPNAFGIVAARSAYAKGEEWLNQALTYIDSNFEFMSAYVKEHLPHAKFRIPEGTFLAWLDLSLYGDTDALMEILVLEEKLLIENGNIFGNPGQGYFRINVGCAKAQLEDCLERITKAINKLERE